MSQDKPTRNVKFFHNMGDIIIFLGLMGWVCK